MGILDDAKDKLGEAAEWVKDKAGHLGEQAQDAAQTLGEKAADARHWVGSRVGSDVEPDARVAGGGDLHASHEASLAEEWVEVTADGSTVDGATAPDRDATAGDAGAHAATTEDDEQDRQG